MRLTGLVQASDAGSVTFGAYKGNCFLLYVRFYSSPYSYTRTQAANDVTP